MALAAQCWTATAPDAPLERFVAPSPLGEIDPVFKALHPDATRRAAVLVP